MPSKLCPHVTLAHYDAPRDERIIRDWRPVAVVNYGWLCYNAKDAECYQHPASP